MGVRLAGQPFSGGGVAGFPFVDPKTHGAAGNGIADDTAALAAAHATALRLGARVHLTPGTYRVTNQGNAADALPYCLRVQATEDAVTFSGQGATIVFPSKTTRALVFEDGATNCRVEGITFEGEVEDDFTLNENAAIYFAGNNTDVAVEGCTFRECTPLVTASGDSTTGRFRFAGNTVLEAPNAISVPSYADVVGNWFVNDAVVSTRSHAVYVFGPAGFGSIRNNVFKNIASEDIQIRAGSARYLQKGQFVISGNLFQGSGGGAIWLGSDSTTHAAGFVVTDNMFVDVGGCVGIQGGSDALIANNQARWTWEYANARLGGNTAIAVGHGGPTLGGHMSPAKNIRIENNTIVHAHPWFALVDFNALPEPGDTVTIGSQTYTWQSGAESGGGTGEVQIQASIAECISRLADEIRGRGWDGTRQNAVLRDDTDCFFNTFSSHGAPTNRLVIVSFADFAISTSTDGVGTTVTATIDNAQACPSGIGVVAGEHVSIVNNTIVDFPFFGLTAHNCIEPTIAGNKLVGCSMFTFANHKPRRRDNEFHRSKASDARGLSSYRLMPNQDGFAIESDNGLIAEQEYSSPELRGYAGVVTVSDGKARTYLFYGSELLNALSPEEPQSIPFRWSDGDTVQIYDTVTLHTFTFKRDTPGALEFNDSASLIALINATGTISAAYAAYVDVGSSPDPELMIELKSVADGAAGNGCALWVTTRARTCGQILRNWYAAQDQALFFGGCDGTVAGVGATETFVFTPVASPEAPLFVQGVDSASHGLAPVAYQADCIPGVGYKITHSASASGAEQFRFRVGGN